MARVAFFGAGMSSMLGAFAALQKGCEVVIFTDNFVPPPAEVLLSELPEPYLERLLQKRKWEVRVIGEPYGYLYKRFKTVDIREPTPKWVNHSIYFFNSIEVYCTLMGLVTQGGNIQVVGKLKDDEVLYLAEEFDISFISFPIFEYRENLKRNTIYNSTMIVFGHRKRNENLRHIRSGKLDDQWFRILFSEYRTTIEYPFFVQNDKYIVDSAIETLLRFVDLDVITQNEYRIVNPIQLKPDSEPNPDIFFYKPKIVPIGRWACSNPSVGITDAYHKVIAFLDNPGG